ncbi:MAG: peptidoglycan DD-metalloendopeptidase family protein [Bacteroidales bacterium]|nr:peptidoglycan DD-metalloendopeptidase family protein [Bacteroidales bacterium]
MKRLLILILFTILTLPAFSQDIQQDTIEKRSWFQRLFHRPTKVVHDTTYIFINDYIEDEEGGREDDDEMMEKEESTGIIPLPFDTLETEDKFQKVILFDNGSWIYLDIPKPDVPDFISNDHWMTSSVHAYTDISIQDLPEEVTLILCDSTHSWHMPGEGSVVSPYKLRRGHKHQGVDLGVSYGKPIYAAFDGIVRVALPTKFTGGYGNVVVLRHANGLETYYGHMTHYIVETGDLVTAGEIIGYCGSTGRSTGPHLHFETRYKGQSFDPERIFDFKEKTLRDTVFTLKKDYFSIYSHEGQSDEESKVAAQQVVPKRITYTIKKGDTLSSIAKKNGTTVSKLCKWNKITPKTKLQIGKKLYIEK